MARFVWCKNDERRVPAFRCLLCKDNCHQPHNGGDSLDNSLEILLKSGKYKERFLMKRRVNVNAVSVDELPLGEEARASDESDNSDGELLGGRVFLLEEGRLTPFSTEAYTTSTLYQVTDSFQVESKLVRPDEPGNLLFEGKKPSRKTVPVMIARDGNAMLFASWDDLEANPGVLSEATEVVGVVPVRQVFVLRRK